MLVLALALALNDTQPMKNVNVAQTVNLLS